MALNRCAAGGESLCSRLGGLVAEARPQGLVDDFRRQPDETGQGGLPGSGTPALNEGNLEGGKTLSRRGSGKNSKEGKGGLSRAA